MFKAQCSNLALTLNGFSNLLDGTKGHLVGFQSFQGGCDGVASFLCPSHPVSLQCIVIPTFRKSSL